MSAFIFLLISFQSQALTQNDFDHLNTQSTLVSQINCQEDHYIMTCFQVDQINCKKITEASYTSCLNMKKGQILGKSKSTIGDWKKHLGECTIRDVEKRLTSKSIQNIMCQKGNSK